MNKEKSEESCKKLEGSIVKACQVEGCSFNRDSKCHALAITIGDGNHPRCDTFVQEKAEGGIETKTVVGACKVASCGHNKNLICGANFIDVIFRNKHPYCNTFQTKYLLKV
ncbi:MAG: hypothetical protein A2231_11255 [Candidatus Firestonebacteria bacterium RIFOXYA2_FULL_40_8]|nr:MAG: hypothetical protein A2231_11255 [Candidatus Firestonebacteria bacterium RIFOXYA2_FULL_40_8]